MYWSGNIFNVATEAGGTGTNRNINFIQATQTKLSIGSTQVIGALNIGFSSSTAGSILGLSPSLTVASGVQNSLAIIPTVNQSSTASSRGLWISPYLQTVGSGTNYLIDAGTNSTSGGAGTHTSSFIVNTLGNTLIGTSTDNGNKLQVNGAASISSDSTINTIKIGKGPGNKPYSTVLGYQASNSNSTGDYTTAIGYQASYSNISGLNNTAVGWWALLYNTASSNTAVGAATLYQNTTGASNTGIGNGALAGNGVGSNNIGIGEAAGNGYAGSVDNINDSSNYSIYIGNYTTSLANGDTNEIVIGHQTIGNGSNTTVIGTTSTATTQIFGNLILSNTLHQSSNGSKLQVYGSSLFGGNTFTKAGVGTGDLLLDNGSTDTPGILMYYGNNSNFGIDSWSGSFDVLSGQLIRITNKLNESGGAVKMAIDTSGNMAVSGFLKASSWRAGQVIQYTMLSYTDVTQLQQGGLNRMATDQYNKDVFYYSYTPLSSSSYIIVHIHLSKYDATQGTGNDSWFSQMKVTPTASYSRDSNGVNNGGLEICYGWQTTVNSFRSGTLFPLTGRYTNSDTNAKVISISVRRDSADDYISYDWTSASFWMRITEIGR
jgi:hypothetical protein